MDTSNISISKVWLIKYLSSVGVDSRRKAEEKILQGRVSVNGNIIKNPATKINPSKDIVLIDGKEVGNAHKLVYILLNKPKGVVSTVSDEFDRKTVLNLVKTEERVYPVGRLDQDSRGAILLTNDGDLTLKLTHPKYHIEKTYQVLVSGKVSEDQLETLRNGVILKMGKTALAKVEVLWEKFNRTMLEMTLFEGKNRQIRRMCGKVNLEVLDLKRVAIGKVKLGDLKEGKFRYLQPEEIGQLVDF